MYLLVFRPEAESEVYLYGVFDGHDGNRMSKFAAQRFPAEILLGQLDDRIDDDDEILALLHQVGSLMLVGRILFIRMCDVTLFSISFGLAIS